MIYIMDNRIKAAAAWKKNTCSPQHWRAITSQAQLSGSMDFSYSFHRRDAGALLGGCELARDFILRPVQLGGCLVTVLACLRLWLVSPPL